MSTKSRLYSQTNTLRKDLQEAIRSHNEVRELYLGLKDHNKRLVAQNKRDKEDLRACQTFNVAAMARISELESEIEALHHHVETAR